MKKVLSEQKERIYKAYKHGEEISSIIIDYDITLRKFMNIMKEIGGKNFWKNK